VDGVTPSEIAAIDQGDATVDDSRLRALIGDVPQTDLHDSLRRTVGYFTEHLA
jgi:hypothetical protein